MKKNGSWKKKILYSVTAAVLFVLLLVLFFRGTGNIRGFLMM